MNIKAHAEYLLTKMGYVPPSQYGGMPQGGMPPEMMGGGGMPPEQTTAKTSVGKDELFIQIIQLKDEVSKLRQKLAELGINPDEAIKGRQGAPSPVAPQPNMQSDPVTAAMMGMSNQEPPGMQAQASLNKDIAKMTNFIETELVKQAMTEEIGPPQRGNFLGIPTATEKLSIKLNPGFRSTIAQNRARRMWGRPPDVYGEVPEGVMAGL